MKQVSPMQRDHASAFRRLEGAFFRLLRRDPPASKMGRSVFWMALVTLALYGLAWLPGRTMDLFRSMADLALLVTLIGVLPRLLQWLRWRMLWKLRNRLLVTYLLIGLAPVVLFGTLAALAAYIFSGQFANFAATAEINTELTELATRNQAFALQLAHLVADHGGAPSKMQLTGMSFSTGELPPGETAPKLGAFLDGKQLPLPWLPDGMQMHNVQLPLWAKAPFRGLVLYHDKVYFRAMDSVQVGTHSIVTISGLPLDSAFLDRLANGLGKITLMPNTLIPTRLHPAELSSQQPYGLDASVPASNGPIIVGPNEGASAPPGTQRPAQVFVTGGTLGKRANLLDFATDLPTLLEMTDWQTGKKYAVVALVTSRPSLLYERLFRQSVMMGTAMRAIFLAAALVFGILQLLALLMASRLSRTVTRSVADLYQATRAVDEGKLDHRIQVTRKDQLAELGLSFNSMAASMERLLEEQKEKERMQNELAIAQEVQANLFPSGEVALPQLELYGSCRPARAVSGDYYDFLLFGEAGVGLAIGDISGKGISAALLMATLHSAVRAYRFCSEEMVEGGKLLLRGGTTGADAMDQDTLAGIFQSPGKVLSLLNRHLYLSTQPEKYATLFLAHYDAGDNLLRYSNGGHLPPLVLRADGSIQRLDRGGTVVGLLEGVTYEEGSVQLAPGDLFIGYSDGVTEPENEFGDFGEGRMLEVVRQNRHLPLPEIGSRLMHALDDWIGAAEQPDDITLVLGRQL
jgi:sigma-B regulation protein RsbU (phosphoserine phosphatase)